MFTASDPRSRRQTRALVLECLLRHGAAYRAEIARETRLTEASVSRILAELRKEEIIVEERRPAPYVGGPTALVTLSKNIPLMGIELSNDRLSVGIGSLDGAMRYVDRVPIRHRQDQEEFEHLFRACLATLSQWTDVRTEGIRQAAIAIPGYSPFGANPLFQWDMDRLRDFLRIELDGIPVAVTNSVIAQACLQRYGNADYPADTDHLFLFVGHGVAGAVVNETTAVDAFLPFEIGHMVMERDGRPCRCGHHGCLEAYTSLTAIAEVLGVSEAELLSHGDRFVDQINPCEAMRADLRDRLYLLGLAVGNALNLQPVDAVVISGWPSLLETADTTSIAQGIDDSLLGGNASDRIRLDFMKPAIGSDPQAAHSYARYCLVRGGAVGPAQHHELPARAAS